jgi:hypothetical protein
VRGEIGGHRLRASAAKCPDRVELCPSVDLKSRHPLEALADKCKNHQNRGNTRMRGLAQSTFSTPPIDVGMDVARPAQASDTRRQKMDLLVGDSRLDPVSDMPIDFLGEANRRLPSAR